MEFVESRSSIWQGAATGLTVSALNHVKHRVQVKAKIDKEFQGIDSNGTISNFPIDLLDAATSRLMPFNDGYTFDDGYNQSATTTKINLLMYYDKNELSIFIQP